MVCHSARKPCLGLLNIINITLIQKLPAVDHVNMYLYCWYYLKTCSAVFFVRPIAQVFRSLKPQDLRVRLPLEAKLFQNIISLFLKFN